MNKNWKSSLKKARTWNKAQQKHFVSQDHFCAYHPSRKSKGYAQKQWLCNSCFAKVLD